jgi:hypothetical protein
MKRLLIGLATAGLLLSAPAFSQSTDQKTDAKAKPVATSTDTNPGTKSDTKAKVNGDAGRLQNDPKQDRVKASTERREHRGDRDRDRVSTRSRTSVGIRVGERHETPRHHRCRTVVVKKRYHHRVVVRHIRRCF